MEMQEIFNTVQDIFRDNFDDDELVITRKAIGDLDALGVDRGDANRRIRDYCARNEIKFPTFPALLNAVGYAEAIEICKGAMK